MEKCCLKQFKGLYVFEVWNSRDNYHVACQQILTAHSTDGCKRLMLSSAQNLAIGRSEGFSGMSWGLYGRWVADCEILFPDFPDYPSAWLPPTLKIRFYPAFVLVELHSLEVVSTNCEISRMSLTLRLLQENVCCLHKALLR